MRKQEPVAEVQTHGRLLALIPLGVGFILLGMSGMTEVPEPPMGRAAYVWQQEWSAEIETAIGQADTWIDRFMVLTAEMRWDKDRDITCRRARPVWSTFSERKATVTPVIRLHHSLSSLMVPHRRTELARVLTRLIQRTQRDMESAGLVLSDVQLDYDCPTSKLPLYEAFIGWFTEMHPGQALSITALPTWMTSPSFEPLCRRVSYFVLQAHSLEKPETIASDVSVCNTTKIPGYLVQASAIGVPFYLSLPTYGYRLIFNEDGMFTGLTAEGPLPALSSSCTTRSIMSSPEAMATVVKAVRARPAKHCVGIAWFRLPVASDRLNWSRETWTAVMTGRTPVTEFATEIRHVGRDLFDIFVRNTGERNVDKGDIVLDVSWPPGTVQAYDILSRFKVDRMDGILTLSGPPPRLGEPLMVGWFRTRATTGMAHPPLELSMVRLEL